MAPVTAADVKRLRDRTGAGMLDCKKALTEADGDVERAVELLRIAGVAKATKRGAERTAGNGLVASTGGALVELNCETDFVAKNEQFIALADRVVAAVWAARAAEDAAHVDLDGQSVQEAVDHLAGIIGEKLALGRVAVFAGQTTVYLHRRSADLPPQVGVLVEYTGSDEPAARATAMQIAAMRPQYVTRDEVPESLLADERRIAEETARAEGKPEKAIPRIIEGRVGGYLKDVVLVDQPSVQDPKRTVGQALEAAGVRVVRFARFEVGKP